MNLFALAFLIAIPVVFICILERYYRKEEKEWEEYLDKRFGLKKEEDR